MFLMVLNTVLTKCKGTISLPLKPYFKLVLHAIGVYSYILPQTAQNEIINFVKPNFH